MKIDRELFAKLDTYSHAVLSWIDDDGYPLQTAATFTTDAGEGVVRIDSTGLPIPTDREVNLIASHIRPKAGEGYDERRYISLWGRATSENEGLVFRAERAWGWDERDIPFFEYAERSNHQASKYLSSLSQERGVEVKPRLSPLWTFLLATRLPFLTATFVPILLGIAIAANDGFFSWGFAIATIIAGAAIHVGLNVANDIFDTVSGADDANVNPTQFSGGSRVIQYGLVSLRGMLAISAVAYAVGIGLGLYLVVARGSLELLLIGLAGVLISVFYTAPPVRLVHRGLGEIATGLGFGPVMVLGAYVVQAQQFAWEPLIASVPVGIFIALVLYVNEIPDRSGDSAVGKRTLPVRWSRAAVVRGFLLAAAAAFLLIAIAAPAGTLPRPTLIALLALPLAIEVYRGISRDYNAPYDLMSTMGKNVQLHLLAGLLLFAGYMVSVIAERVAESPPAILT
ncbi:MAG: prenyltransferase [Dehalococcoidia bacterium]